MKLCKLALLMLACFSLIAPLGADAASLSLYDDFSGGVIDASKWTPPEVVREIRSGKLVSALRWLGLGSGANYDLPLASPFSSLVAPNDSFQAVVRLNDYRVPGVNSGRAALNLRGSYLNDGTGSAGSALGDVRAWLTLRGTSSGVEVVYDIIKCSNAACTSFYVLGTNQHVASGTLGTPVTLVLSWDNVGKAFTFQAGSESTTVFASTLMDPQTGMPLKIGGLPHLAYRALGMDTLVSVLGAGGEVFASGDFDDVVLNGTSLDDFNGSTLDSSKWASGELVREAQGGALVSKTRTSYAGGRVRNVLGFTNRNAVTAIKIDVTVTAAEATNARVQARALAGAFYNDGSGNPATTDMTGDIEAYLRFVSDPAVNGGALTAQFLLDRCSDAACNAANTFFTDNVTGVTLGQVYTLQLSWDGTQFTYGIASDIRSFNPSTDPRVVTHYPPVRPAISHFKDFRTDVNPFAPGASGYMAVVFDNVYVNADAVQIPRLARSYQRQVTGNVVSAGASLRHSGSGTITLSGIPGGATIEKALLYWATIGDTPATSATFQGGPVLGTVIGRADDPLQGFFQSYAYRADVTSLVTGNGAYTVAGLPDGSGTPPLNDSEGASLVVIYSAVGAPTRVITIHDGVVMLAVSGLRYYAPAMTGFVASNPVGDAHFTLIVGDGTVSTGYELVAVNTTVLADSFGDTFHGADPATPPATPSWDTRQFDAITGVSAGATMVRPAVSPGNDSLLWVAAIFSVTGTVHTDAVGAWRPAEGNWYIRHSQTGTVTVQQWGAPTDVPVAGDFDGDGQTDIAVWRPAEGNWYIRRSSDAGVVATQWGAGALNDIPVPGDYDGDRKTDLAVWRPAEGNWYIRNSQTGTVTVQQWGTTGDVPVAGDYDGDGKTDIAVWRPGDGNWYIRNSQTGTVTVQQWGTAGDVPVAGDFDGDGKPDIAVWRPVEGNWYIRNSQAGTVTVQQWGAPTDIPVPGDYDGDGKTDIAVWRPAEGNWYIINSATGAVTVQQWGTTGDLPVVGKW